MVRVKARVRVRAEVGLHALTIGRAARVDVLARRVTSDEGDGADRRLIAQEVDRVVRAWSGLECRVRARARARVTARVTARARVRARAMVSSWGWCVPWMMLSTPSGRPASVASSARRMAVRGTRSDGLRT